MKRSLSNIISCTLLGLASMAAASCSMMHEDLDDCPTGLYVRFIYDYNTQRADMFMDHVGHVQLYIFDENGRLAAQRTVSNTASDSPLRRYGYTMHFTEQELAPGHSYRLQAVAMQRDWDEALAAEGAKYRHSASPTEHSESLTISLDHHNEQIEGTEQFQISNIAPLDTLWHTLKVIPHAPADGLTVPDMDRTSKPFSIYPQEDQLVRVEKDHATYATVSLIRDTKHLTLTLHQVDTPETVFADDYEVKIIDNNAHLSHDNTVLTHDSVRYTPYASWTTRRLDDGRVEIETVHNGNLGQIRNMPTRDGEDDTENVVERIGHYNLMFNRLIHNRTDNKDNARLEIHNRKTGELVGRFNLPYYLAYGRGASDFQNFGDQEYLDREYDYHLNLFLKGDKWYELEIAVHVLSWSKRIQNVNL
ncbi:MAG: FimB/Mfa2 family fimbrial subunit [Muribaculaceae bacterium]|nr:FimB/Mfa2 family fimbrial subunit [Muribaculaceae bacterium]